MTEQPKDKASIVDLFRESVIFQGLITMTVLIVWAVLMVEGKPISQDLYVLLGTVIGFFFGGKYQQLIAQNNRDNQNTIRAITKKEDC